MDIYLTEIEKKYQFCDLFVFLRSKGDGVTFPLRGDEDLEAQPLLEDHPTEEVGVEPNPNNQGHPTEEVGVESSPNPNNQRHV